MAVIDILNIQPNVVSRDLNSYTYYIFGAPKTGKTYLASRIPDSLLLGFEVGYKTIPGIIAVGMPDWATFKGVLTQLRKPEVKAKYKCIVIDTVDLAAKACEKFLCQQNGVDDLGDIAWGKGTSLLRTELIGAFNQINLMGYSLFFISHSKDKTFTPEGGEAYNQIIPTLKPSINEWISGMSDIYAYAHTVSTEDGDSETVLTIRSADNRVECGSRFKYIVPEVEFTYEALVKAIGDAIDKEAEVNGKDAVTDEPAPVVSSDSAEESYDDLRKEFDEVVTKLRKKKDFAEKYAPLIVEATNKYLGTGNKVVDTTPAQAAQLELIVAEIKELL